MGVLVRSITFGALVIAAFVAGCGRTHGRDEDGGARDAAADDASLPVDSGDASAGTERDAGDAAPDAGDAGSRPCARPISEWVPETLTLAGEWDAMELARDPASPWVVASPAGGGPMHALALDPDADARPVRSTVLEGTEGGLVRATDGDRFRIVTVVDDAVLVHDTAGRLVSREPLSRAAEGAVRIALRDVRVGTIVAAPEGALAEVRDVAGGPPISSTMLDGWSEVAIADGRGLFAFVASDGSLSHYWGLDELGAIRAASLGVLMRMPSGDGTTFVAIGAGGLVARHAGGRLEERPAPPGSTVWSAPTVAEGPLGPVIAWATDVGTSISIDSGAWILVHEPIWTLRYAMADQGTARAGAFLHDGRTIRWAGLVCPR